MSDKESSKIGSYSEKQVRELNIEQQKFLKK